MGFSFKVHTNVNNCKLRLLQVTRDNLFCRCPSYQNMASTCVMVTDTNDPCCMVPKCGFDVATGQIPVPVPSYSQATTGVGIVKPPVPTLYPTVYPDGPWVILNTTGGQPLAPTAPTNVKQGKFSHFYQSIICSFWNTLNFKMSYLAFNFSKFFIDIRLCLIGDYQIWF